MIKFSEPKIEIIKIDYYDKDYRYTTVYPSTIYIPANNYYDKNILKCEIRFRYKLKLHIHILTGDITIIDIYKEILRILNKRSL